MNKLIVQNIDRYDPSGFAYDSILKEIKCRKRMMNLFNMLSFSLIILFVSYVLDGKLLAAILNLGIGGILYNILTDNINEIKKLSKAIEVKQNGIKTNQKNQKKRDFYRKELEFFKNV